MVWEWQQQVVDSLEQCMSAGEQQRVSSGDAERSSHRAAARVGQGGRKGGREGEGYRIGYSNRDFCKGRDLIPNSMCLPPFFSQLYLQMSHISHYPFHLFSHVFLYLKANR